ncbi:hypothetical protein Tco_0164499 [Tanacetum coccineum]
MTFGRIIKTPIRAMSKVLDAYVRSANNFSNTYHKPLRTMETTHESQQLRRSFTTSTNKMPYNDESPESALVRTISTAATGSSRATNLNIAELDAYIKQQDNKKLQSFAASKGVPRSCSVGMGRIDEDRASSFRGIQYRYHNDFK